MSVSTEPLGIKISGLQAGQRVSLTVTSTDSRGFQWKSLSTYIAGPAGTVSPHLRPLGPSYTGLDAMGPFDSIVSYSKPEPVYF